MLIVHLSCMPERGASFYGRERERNREQEERRDAWELAVKFIALMEGEVAGMEDAAMNDPAFDDPTPENLSRLRTRLVQIKNTAERLGYDHFGLVSEADRDRLLMPAIRKAFADAKSPRWPEGGSSER